MKMKKPCSSQTKNFFSNTFFRDKAKKEGNAVKSASHRIVPEVEHLLETTFPTDIHDLGSHTVSVTHLDLDATKRLDEEASKDEEETNSSSSNEEEGKITTSSSKKSLQKTLSKSVNKLQNVKENKKKSGKKFNSQQKKSKKTAKPKRLKHNNPRRLTK